MAKRSRAVDDSVIDVVARELHSSEAYRFLIRLGIDEDRVGYFRTELLHGSTSSIVRKLLSVWLISGDQDGVGGTYEAIHKALRQIGRNDLAGVVEEQLKQHEEDPVAVQTALESQAVLNDDEAEMPSMQSRIVFCGPPRVGKSCAKRSFLDQKFQKTDSTPGVNISQVTCTAVEELKGNWKWKEVTRAEHDIQAALYTLSRVPAQRELQQMQMAGTELGPKSDVRNPTLDSGELSPSVAELLRVIRQDPHKFKEMAKEKMHFLDLWDCGGQQAFAAFQRFIMSGRHCAYTIVYDASKELSELLEETYCVMGSEKRLLTKAKNLTVYDVIEGWLDVLYSIATVDGVNPSDILFYFLGCQADKIKGCTKDEKRKRDMKYIQRRITDQGKPYAQRFIEQADEIFFLVSNLRSGEKDADPDLSELRNCVSKHLMGHGDKYKLKVCWLPFAGSIRFLQFSRRQRKEVILPLQSVSVVAKEACNITDKNELTDLLTFFHHVGRILYFSGCTKLQDWVFIDVPGLVKLVSSLFIPPSQDLVTTDSPFRTRYELLYKDGILLESLMDAIWTKYCPDEKADYQDHLDLIIELMGKFGLLYETGRLLRAPGMNLQSREFILPSMAMMPNYTDREEEQAYFSRLYKQLSESTILITREDNRSFAEEKFWQSVVLCLRSLSAKTLVENSPVSVCYRSASISCNRGDASEHKLELTYLRDGVGVHIACDHHEGATPKESSDTEVQLRLLLLKIVQKSLREAMGLTVAFREMVWCPKTFKCLLHGNKRDCHELDCQHFVDCGETRCTMGHNVGDLDLAAYKKWWKRKQGASEAAGTKRNRARDREWECCTLS